jgi:hypothetical protein
MPDLSKPLVDAVVASAGWINGLLITGVALSGVIVILKLAGKGEFEVWKVPVKTSYAWAIAVLLTIAHYYVTVLFLRDCDAIFDEGNAAVAQGAWDRLSGGSLLFFHGLVARLTYTEWYVGGKPYKVFHMDRSDPTTWLAHGAAVLVFLAIARFRGVRWFVRIGTCLAGLLVMYANSHIGAQWAITASYLKLMANTPGGG